MLEYGLPSTTEEGIDRVQMSRSASQGFAFIGMWIQTSLSRISSWQNRKGVCG